MATLNDLRTAFGFDEKTKSGDFHYYGEIKRITSDGKYEVSLNGQEGATVHCSRLSGADVGDVVMVTVLANGHAVVTNTIGGDKDAVKAFLNAQQAKNKAVEANAMAEDAKQGVTSLTGTVNEQGQTITNLDGHVTSLSGTVNEQGTHINNLSDNVTSLGTTVNEQGQTITNLDGNVTELDDMAQSAYESINDLDRVVNGYTDEETGEEVPSLSYTISEVNSRVDTAEDSMASTNSRINDTNTSLDDGISRISNLEQQSLSISNRLKDEINLRKDFIEIQPDESLGGPYIAIGNSKSKAVQMLSDKLLFLDGDSIVASITDDQLDINRASIKTFLQFANFAFIPRNNGNLALKWVGG